MNRGTRIAIVVAVLILLVGGGIFGWRAYANQQAVKRLKAQLVAQLKEQKSLGPPRREAFESLRQQVAGLPEQYQRQFQQSARRVFMGEFERRVDEYLAMNKEDRKKELDKRIAEMENMRKSFEARRKQDSASQSAPSAGGSSSSGGGAAPGGGQASGGPNGGGPPGGPGGPGGPFGGRGPGGLSGILDNTTPKFRAKMAVVMGDMEKRRAERGLPPMPGPFRPR